MHKTYNLSSFKINEPICFWFYSMGWYDTCFFVCFWVQHMGSASFVQWYGTMGMLVGYPPHRTTVLYRKSGIIAADFLKICTHRTVPPHRTTVPYHHTHRPDPRTQCTLPMYRTMRTNHAYHRAVDFHRALLSDQISYKHIIFPRLDAFVDTLIEWTYHWSAVVCAQQQ